MTAAILAPPAAAQLLIWDGTGDNNWNSPDNWDPGPVPNAGSTARFDGVTGNSNAVRSLIVGGFDASVRRIEVVAGAGAYDVNTNGNMFNIGEFPGSDATAGIHAASNASFTVNNNFGIVIFFNGSSVSGDVTINNVSGNLLFTDASGAGTARINIDAVSTANFDAASSAQNATIVNDGQFLFSGTASAGNAQITNNNFMQFGALGSGPISTAGNANIQNSATGFLLFSGDSIAGNATIANANGATLVFTDNSDGGTARIITEANALVNFAASAGTGGLGTFTVGSIEGDGDFLIGGFHTTFMVGGNNRDFVVSGVIAECCTAMLVKTGTGTMTVTNANTYTGGTRIAQGTLQIGNGGTTGSVIGNIVNDSILAINRSDTFNFANNISGTGALHHVGTGTTTLTGNNTYAGATNVLAGTLRAGTANAFGLGGPASVAAGATLDLNSFDRTFASLAGAGNVMLGSATLAAGGDNSSTTFSGVISGTGAFVKNGTGTMILSGTNTFTGGTTVAAGTLQLGDGGATGSVVGPIVVNGILALNRSDNFTLANAISGNGGLQQNGPGVTTLDGGMTYTGATAVNGGGLIVNTSLVSSSMLNVAAGAFIGGTGTLPSTTVSGTLRPGNSIGTINIQGNLVMTASGVYAVEVSPTAADRVNVSNNAALAGTVQATFASGSYVQRSYTILSAGSVSGAFASLTTSGLPAGFTTDLSYTSTSVELNLTANLGAPTPTSPGAIAAPLPANQQNVATALNNFFNAGGALPPGFVSVFGLTGGSLNNALSQLSGEPATGAASAGIQLMNQFLALLLNPFAERRDGFGPGMGYAAALPADIANAYAAALPVKARPVDPFGSRWSVWGAAYGGANRTDGDAAGLGTADVRPRAYGFAAGADYRVAPGTLVGFALAGGGTSWSLSNGLGGGKSDVFQAGLYASKQFGAAYLSGAVAYAWHDASTERTLTVAGADRLDGSFDVDNVGARFEGGYRFAAGLAGVTPYAAVQVQSYRMASFAEAASIGSAQFALAYAGRTLTATRTELGAWFDTTISQQAGSRLALRGRVAWANDQGSDISLTPTFQALPGASFIVNGAKPPENLALVTLGADWRFANNLSLGAKFDGEFASRSQTYSGAGYARYVW